MSERVPPRRTPTDRWLAQPADEVEVSVRQALDEAAERDADEVALRRVWARLARDPGLEAHIRALEEPVGTEPRRVRWQWLALTTLGGAAAVAAVFLLSGKAPLGVSPKAAVVPAEVPVLVDGSARSGLVTPALVRAGKGETLRLALPGKVDAVVTSESALALDSQSHPTVSAGEVQFAVPHQAPGKTFSVGVDKYRVVVVGTRFSVALREGRSAVAVTAGVVEVWSDHRLARITAGQSWSSPAVASEHLGENSDAVASVDAAKAGSGPGAKSGAGDDRTSVSRATSRRRGHERVVALAGAPVSASGRAGSTAAAAVATSSAADNAVVGARGTTVATTATATATTAPPTPSPREPATEARLAPPPAAAPAVQPTPQANDDSVLLTQARSSRAAGDSRRALNLYRSLALRGGPVGENAEYEIGSLLRDDLHQPVQAVSAWRAYRASHPRGLLSVEAEISVIETLVSMGAKAQALSDASDFVAHHPDNERRAEISRLAGDLARERGDCDKAIAAYDVAIAAARSQATADRASYHRAVCLWNEDRGDGAKAMRAYLGSFPRGRYRAPAERALGETGTVAGRP